MLVSGSCVDKFAKCGGKRARGGLAPAGWESGAACNCGGARKTRGGRGQSLLKTNNDSSGASRFRGRELPRQFNRNGGNWLIMYSSRKF